MTTPTYTYTYSPITNPVDQIRLWISDRILFFDPNQNAMVMNLADQEIQGYINECSSLYEAAASCCESIAAAYASKHQYSKMVGDTKVSENYNKQHENWIAMAVQQRKRHATYKPIAPAVQPTSLESYEETGIIAHTTEFWTGQFDDVNPVGGADPDVKSIFGA